MKTTTRATIKLCRLLLGLAALSTLDSPLATVFAQGTAFTYQGRLNAGTNSANGIYDLTFTLFDALSGPGQVGNSLTNSSTSVSNGLFTVTLDFGANFPGADRWLEIGVRTNGAGSFATLTPRQELTPTPYAIAAENVIPGAGLSGTYGGAITLSNSANQFTGSFAGNGANVTNVDAAMLGGLSASSFWQLAGNAGTTPGVNFLGTRDNQPLQIKVNNAVALQIAPAPSLPNIVAGLAAYRPTLIRTNVSGAVVAGGAAPSYPVTGFGAGDYHAVFDNDGTIGGGFGNKVGTDNGDPTDAAFATVAGGVFNSAGAYAATVAGGDANYAGGGHSAVLGGFGNQVLSTLAVLGGGFGNTIQSNAANSTIGGGYNNLIQTNDYDATIGGAATMSSIPAPTIRLSLAAMTTRSPAAPLIRLLAAVSRTMSRRLVAASAAASVTQFRPAPMPRLSVEANRI